MGKALKPRVVGARVSPETYERIQAVKGEATVSDWIGSLIHSALDFPLDEDEELSRWETHPPVSTGPCGADVPDGPPTEVQDHGFRGFFHFE